MSQKIAIVGIGPRGLSALESLSRALSQSVSPVTTTLLLFDDSGYPGCGPNYAPDQPMTNVLNIPCREVPLSARAAITGQVNISGFQSYNDWQSEHELINNQGQDVYPSRASIGEYLQARFRSWIVGWQSAGSVEIITTSIIDIEHCASSLVLVDNVNRRYEDITHALLTIGHQPVERDKSLEHWAEISDRSDVHTFFEHPYPAQTLIDSEEIGSNDTVAIRGLGLSMIDVVKALTEGRGGKFTPRPGPKFQFDYTASSSEPAMLLPYSLDGLPMAPKPANELVDSFFKLSEIDRETLLACLTTVSQYKNGDQLRNDIIKVVAEISAGVFSRLDERQLIKGLSPAVLTSTITHWLDEDNSDQSGIVSQQKDTVESMRDFLQMSLDQAPISIDYCVGQVWRHCQPMFYTELAHIAGETALLAAFIELDGRMKRYAFGPPVDSVARLLSLCDAGVLRFAIADDPIIKVHDKGWTLQEDNAQIVASVMVNSVLASPALLSVSTPLVKSLIRKRLLRPISDKLGAITDKSGLTVSAQDSRSNQHIALVGRLAIGSIVEADALLECFGPELDVWARAL